MGIGVGGAEGGGGHVAGGDTLQHEPEDRPGDPKTEPQLPARYELVGWGELRG